MNKILGPLLIIIGLFLLELISLSFPIFRGSEKIQNIFKNMGVWGVFPLGALFALSMCPVAAALFFGSLIPLASKISSLLLLPSMYGLGTGLPILLCALVIAFSTNGMDRLYHNITKFEYWFRKGTGWVFVGVGVYISLAYMIQII